MRISGETIAKQVFGSKLKRKILNFLLKNQEPLSEREMSRILGVSNTAVNKAMRQLLDMNIVKGKTIGNSLVWELNEKSYAYKYVKAFLEASEVSPLSSLEDMIKSNITVFNALVAFFEEKKGYPPITTAHIFGSVAEGTSGPDSDIDILIITKTPSDKKRLEEIFIGWLGVEILEKIGNKASFHIYSESAVSNNDPGWLAHAINTGIKVYG